MPPKISVLVPVYNAEKYLCQCLDSIYTQTFTDFEIVAINDGSTDTSADILKQYACKDKRLRVILQPNAGIAVTRNRLLQEAHGTYFFFIDSDDWLRAECLQVLYECAEQSGADIVQGWYEEYDENTNRYTPCNNLYHLYNGPKPPTRVQERFKVGRSYLQVWGRLTKTSIVQANQLRFLPNRLAEDSAFSIALCLCANHIEFVERPVMVYRRSNIHSLSHQWRHMHFDILEQWCVLTHWCAQRNFQTKQLYDTLLHLIIKNCMVNNSPWSTIEKQQMQLALKTVKNYARQCSWYRYWRYALFARLAQDSSPKWISRWAWLLR